MKSLKTILIEQELHFYLLRAEMAWKEVTTKKGTTYEQAYDPRTGFNVKSPMPKLSQEQLDLVKPQVIRDLLAAQPDYQEKLYQLIATYSDEKTLLISELKTMGLKESEINGFLELQKNYEAIVNNHKQNLQKGSHIGTKIWTDLIDKKFVDNPHAQKLFLEGLDEAISTHGTDWQAIDKNVVTTVKAVETAYSAYMNEIATFKDLKTENDIVNKIGKVTGSSIELAVNGALLLGVGPTAKLMTGAAINTILKEAVTSKGVTEAAKAILGNTDVAIDGMCSLANVSNPYLLGMLAGSFVAAAINYTEPESFPSIQNVAMDNNFAEMYEELLSLREDLESTSPPIDLSKLLDKDYSELTKIYESIPLENKEF